MPSDTSSLNPGMTHRLALVVEQPATATTTRATVAIRDMTYIGEGGGASTSMRTTGCTSTAPRDAGRFTSASHPAPPA